MPTHVPNKHKQRNTLFYLKTISQNSRKEYRHIRRALRVLRFGRVVAIDKTKRWPRFSTIFKNVEFNIESNPTSDFFNTQ